MNIDAIMQKYEMLREQARPGCSLETVCKTVQRILRDYPAEEAAQWFRETTELAGNPTFKVVYTWAAEDVEKLIKSREKKV